MVNHNHNVRIQRYDCPCHRDHIRPSASSSTSKSIRKADRIIPRAEIVERIIQGENLVVYHDQVLDLTRWTEHHPGGQLAVLHFVGRDASDEMDAYHSKDDLKRVRGFVVGRVAEKVSSAAFLN